MLVKHSHLQKFTRGFYPLTSSGFYSKMLGGFSRELKPIREGLVISNMCDTQT